MNDKSPVITWEGTTETLVVIRPNVSSSSKTPIPHRYDVRLTGLEPQLDRKTTLLFLLSLIKPFFKKN